MSKYTLFMARINIYIFLNNCVHPTENILIINFNILESKYIDFTVLVAILNI